SLIYEQIPKSKARQVYLTYVPNKNEIRVA
ncbi:unnamed protein product, partial [marine sediment metagenome]